MSAARKCFYSELTTFSRAKESKERGERATRTRWSARDESSLAARATRSESNKHRDSKSFMVIYIETIYNVGMYSERSEWSLSGHCSSPSGRVVARRRPLQREERVRFAMKEIESDLHAKHAIFSIEWRASSALH